MAQTRPSDSLYPVTSGPGRSGELTFAPLWGQRGTNACHQCHPQLEQTELTAAQLGTNAAEKERRFEKKRSSIKAELLRRLPQVAQMRIFIYTVHTKPTCISNIVRTTQFYSAVRLPFHSLNAVLASIIV